MYPAQLGKARNTSADDRRFVKRQTARAVRRSMRVILRAIDLDRTDDPKPRTRGWKGC